MAVRRRSTHPVPRETVREAVRVFKALADPTRYRLLTMLVGREELGCAEVARAFALTAPALSHHYRVLEHAGLVHTRKVGSHVFIRLNRKQLNRFVPGWPGAARRAARNRRRGRPSKRS
jgi:DNA-binding transcriptional ArsR family regulator